jgi:hypothetical protein
MFSLSSVSIALALTSSAYAALFVTSPTEAIGFTAGQQSTITWIDDTNQPPLASFGLSSIAIYAGNSIEQTNLQTISESVDVTNPMSISFTPNASIGPDGPQYFIRFQSLSAMDPNDTSIPLLAFSHVFALSGMTGTFDAEVQSEINGQSTAPIGGVSVTATSSPPSSNTANAIITSKTSNPSASASASKTSAKPTASGTSAAVPAFVAGRNSLLGIAAGVLSAVVGAALL